MRSDTYISQNQTVTRTELPGKPLEILEWTRTTRHRNKDWPTRVVHWVGLHSLRIGGEEITAVRSTVSDAGCVGVSVVYTKPFEVEPTQEDRERTRQNLQRVAAQAMYDQGLW